LAAAIFVAGMVVGAGVTVRAARNQLLEAVHHPETVPPRIAARLQWKLGLSEEQTAKATAIIEQHRLAIQQVRREFQPQIEAELDLAETEIAAVLNDAQRAEWEEHFRTMRATWLPDAP
jgi:hypothetical protein